MSETARSAESHRFLFRFAPAYRAAARPFGVTPATAWVEVDDERLSAHYGPWRVRTPLGNIAAVDLTGPYRFVKTAGPARLGLTDFGLTFASNGDSGVLITFHDKVPGIAPSRRLRHPELTVTVADTEGLAALLRARAQL